MTPADAYQAGLDPVHVLAICTRATGGGTGAHAVGTPDGVRVSLPTRKAAWDAAAALGRAGYTASLAGRTRNSRDLVVTGWSASQLDWRLTALRTVMHRLADNPLVTATAAVRRFGALPASAASPAAAADILDQTRQQLQDWVDGRAGICVPAPPAVIPADAGNAVRVRAVTACEQVISDLVERHLRVAGHALALFGSLRQQMNDGRAQKTAVRRAGVLFHPSGGSIAQDSSSLMRAATTSPAPCPTPPADPPGRSRSRPGWDASREFPAPPGVAGPTDAAPSAGWASPGGQDFPTARPGRHR